MRIKIISILLFIGLFLLCCTSPFDPNITVYITQSGTKYHKEDCSYLSSSKIAITLGEACAKGYSPCSVCKPPNCK
jgi:hypothetical protein